MKEQRFVREVVESRRRVMFLSAAVTVVFVIVLLRLWHLQILNTENYQNLSENNRLRFVPVAALRGTLLDRNGKILVGNRPSFSLAVIPQEVKDRDALIDRLVSLLGLDREELIQKWDKSKGRARYYPVVLASNISREQVEIIAENSLVLPGVEIEMKPVRQYYSEMLAAHLLGYISEISEDELNAPGYEEYYPGDYVGKNGIEKAWEDELHGRDGGRQLEVDARGRVLRTISESLSQVGNSIVLTIDQGVQKQTEQAFGDKAGAAVLMDVNSGEILAFASNPGFDPSLFTGRMPVDKWEEYLEDKRHPLENKALTGQYPPGSTFKIITALAGLEQKTVDERTQVTCRGYYELGKGKFNCWKKEGHGSVALRRSLKESCDVYYYELAEKTGIAPIASMARRFGFGQPMGIGLLHEKGGVVPDNEWKLKKHGQKWLQGDTIPAAIGQGYVLMTPVQLASMVATVANDGTVYRPHLVKRIMDSDGKVLKEFKPEVLKVTGIPQEHLKLVKQGLFSVVNEAGGTGGAARLYDAKVAGKTGTSQVVKLRKDKGNIPYKYRDHALFVAYAPYDRPEVAVAVVVEHGEHGGGAAAPVAGRILRAYFDSKKPPPKPVSDGRDEEDEEEDEKTPEAGAGREKEDSR